MRTDGDDDYLDEDPIIPSQQWALVSIISPATVNAAPDFKWDMRLLKIRYICETEAQADEKSKYFHKIDQYHHIIKMRIGRWSPFDDRDECAEEVNYGEERMNNMMKAFKEQQKKADEYENDRRANAKRNLEKDQKILEARRRRRTNKKNKIKKIDLESIGQKIEQSVGQPSLEDLMNSGIILNKPVEDELSSTIASLDQKVATQKSNISKIDQEFAKVQEQLAKLQQDKS